ncbi:peptidoglycan-binding protein [Streptomyces sp. GD-15H]|uniref:peptidoglycan-binding protein n=1 Tax=Streptomyces sp. GD-15H TaxID=3129112 RepID=UPI00324649A0
MQDEQTAARGKKDTAAPEPAPAPGPEPASDADAARYEPYPGAVFFHGGRHSAIVAAMARRLEQEDCSDSRSLGADWTRAHRDAFAAWQRQLRPKEGGDTSGIPDQIAWDRLQVPRVTPLPKES